MRLSSNQRESGTQSKTDAGYLDDSTPPYSFIFNEKGYDLISNFIVSDIQANIINTNFTSTSGLVPLHPVPGPIPPIPPLVTTDANSHGQYFVIIVTCQQPHSDSI